MSFIDSLNRQYQKRETIKREHERAAKRALFECELLDTFEHDEIEIEAMRESSQRYAISH